MSCSQWGTVQRRALSHEAQKCGTPPQRHFSPEDLVVCLASLDARQRGGRGVRCGRELMDKRPQAKVFLN